VIKRRSLKLIKALALLCFVFLGVSTSAQTESAESNFIAIDHVPIVVHDLAVIKQLFSDELHFRVKDGRVHEGINNCFIKFENGTYLEFIVPLDSTQSIGKYYTTWLKAGSGATVPAISIRNRDELTKYLTARKIEFTLSANKVWSTITVQSGELFYIDYLNKNWRDPNTTHSNQALSLETTWILSNDIEGDSKKYQSYGFKQFQQMEWQGVTVQLLSLGISKLALLDAKSPFHLSSDFESPDRLGICGFTIKVASLEKLNSMLINLDKVELMANRTVVLLKDYNLFLEFVE